MAFAVFLPVVFILYWICPAKYRYLFLLAASFYFYMHMDMRYAFLLLFTAAVSFFLALALQSANSRPENGASEKRKIRLLKKIYLLAGIILLAGCLFTFKYLDFFFEAAGPASPAIQLMLPVGISFYTFQTLGYLIDIYRGKYPAERHFGYYCLFVSFFPQLLSGPIGRGDILLPQFKKTRVFNPVQASYGLKLMAVGYFKKLVIAELLAPSINSIYDNPGDYTGLVFPITTVMFAVQIYCDFSGYTDIAIGCAKLFGIELQENFKSPYFSRSVREFWSRWHISLSTWFRDYVYIPLGGSRKGIFRHCLNLLLTFLASGLWHGAGIHYIVWGAIHGTFLILEVCLLQKGCLLQKRLIKPKRQRGFFSLLLTFAEVCFAWIFFRANTLQDAWHILSHSLCGIGDFTNYLKNAVVSLDMSYSYMIYLCLPVLLLAVYDCVSLKTDVIACISSCKPWVRYPVYIVFLLVILLFSEKGVSTEFYYFQF